VAVCHPVNIALTCDDAQNCWSVGQVDAAPRAELPTLLGVSDADTPSGLILAVGTAFSAPEGL